MKLSSQLLFLPVLLLALTAACGDDDEPTQDVLSAPKVVSTNPAQGATDVATGPVTLTVTYDQNISFSSSSYTQIAATGATVSGARAAEKTLTVQLNCPEAGTQVSVSIPAGLVRGVQQPAPAFSLQFTTQKAATPAQPATDGHETAAQAVAAMGPGWNLGNTLDCYGQWIGNHQPSARYETAWGQPLTDAHLMQALRAKGFGAIRVPVTWLQHIDDEGNVDQEWMDRVQQVVDYVLQAGMYCILNTHHDTGAHDDSWLRADATVFARSRDRYARLWTQIATRFRDYDGKLLFEGYNEMLDNQHTWNAPRNSSDLGVVNQYAQVFVDAVRATGGGNTYRNLVVNTYSGAHGTAVLNALVVPTDPCGNQSHLAVEVHSYDPWNWVNTYRMTWTAECRSTLETMFRDLNSRIIAKGYPVIVGEYGSNGEQEATINKNSTSAQKQEAGRQGADMGRLCRQYGCAAFYWMGLIEGADRAEATFRWSMEETADSIVSVY